MNGQAYSSPPFPGPVSPAPVRMSLRPYTTGRTDPAPANGLPPSEAGAVREVNGHLVPAAVAALRQGGGPQPTTEKGMPR
ncbi:hypothetical protein SRIMR7_39835 [Streptomyces rimosus subsp. rimosus]|uniref:Uncharacterized protein n=1 Tax=Streptomyces rimosus subsp. rimosus TaxID=132474 RepID=A0ABY3ZG25_STRRM|nr:hypothetical protein SRIMR7_39835 [Streptomyces rimosus subsp. rimosus]